jgi:DNA-binding response OmpR family regulator
LISKTARPTGALAAKPEDLRTCDAGRSLGGARSPVAISISSEDHVRTRDAGFDDHLLKPVDLTALERSLAG